MVNRYLKSTGIQALYTGFLNRPHLLPPSDIAIFMQSTRVLALFFMYLTDGKYNFIAQKTKQICNGS